MFPFEVDSTTDVPLWVQLRQRLVYLINSGYFKPGDQLPTVRGLASEISINYNTVSKVYINLEHDGYVESVRGRGVFVRDIGKLAADDVAYIPLHFQMDVYAVGPRIDYAPRYNKYVYAWDVTFKK